MGVIWHPLLRTITNDPCVAPVGPNVRSGNGHHLTPIAIPLVQWLSKVTSFIWHPLPLMTTRVESIRCCPLHIFMLAQLGWLVFRPHPGNMFPSSNSFFGATRELRWLKRIAEALFQAEVVSARNFMRTEIFFKYLLEDRPTRAKFQDQPSWTLSLLVLYYKCDIR